MTSGPRLLLACSIAAALLFTGGCTRVAEPPAPMLAGAADPLAARFADALSKRVTTDAMMAHLGRLQDIADANGDTRAVGSPGYQAAADYVAGVLRSAGFEVSTPEFQVRVFEAETPRLTVGDAQIDATPLRYTAGTPPEGVRGPLVAAPAGETPGCAAADYDGLPVRGAVLLVDRGGCRFTAKHAVAAEVGAVGMIIANNIDEEFMAGSLGEDNAVAVPAISVSKSAGARLRAAPGPTTIVLEATTREIGSTSVIAQTTTGSTSDVVLVGAHLDSAAEGPGANDNGSGVAAVLETAVQLGPAPDVNQAVRFAFWGAEEVGLVGSSEYVDALDLEQLRDIALYLNFDMLASPNPGYFTLDGDQSLPPDPDAAYPRVPEGSAGIERALAGYLKAAGKPAADAPFDGRSDYRPFIMAGIPSGGLFSGADATMTAEQAQMWGGVPDEPFDPNYHKDTDVLDRIDRTALGINGRGVAYAVGLYAIDVTGRNGVPVREDRTRHVSPGK